MMAVGDAATEWNVVMATTLLAMLPPVAGGGADAALVRQGPVGYREVDESTWPPSPCASREDLRPRRQGRARCCTASTSRSPTASSSCIVGPPAAARRTLLRMVAGLEDDHRRRDRTSAAASSTDLEPGERDIAMVFQNYALYPHMTVFDNMAYGLKIAGRRRPRSRRASRRRPSSSNWARCWSASRAQLSGGQRQRVAMGRAIVRQPAGVPVRRAAVQPRRQAARADAARDPEAAPASSASPRSSSPTTRSRR